MGTIGAPRDVVMRGQPDRSRSRRWPVINVPGNTAARSPRRSLGDRAAASPIRRQSLQRANLLRLRALGAAHGGVLHPLVVIEAAVPVGLDRGVVNEDVRRAIVGGDETKALVRVEPLHCSLSHYVPPC